MPAVWQEKTLQPTFFVLILSNSCEDESQPRIADFGCGSTDLS